MPETIITLYCFFDELLKALGHKDDPQARLSTAEIMTIAAVAAELFTGNQHGENSVLAQKALDLLIGHGYVKPFSKSRFNRRLHRIPEALWQLALFVLAQIHQKTNRKSLHIVDTFPVPGTLWVVPEHPHPAVQNLSRQSLPRLLRQQAGVFLIQVATL